jgi:hypothetical protein
MTLGNKQFRRDMGAREAGVVKLYGRVVTSTSGTIDSQVSRGFTVTKTAAKTGRYTITLDTNYNKLLMCNVMIQGADDSAYTSAKGLTWFVRAVDVAANSTSAHLFYLQFCDPDGSPADSELPDGTIFSLEVTVKNSSIY